MKNLFLHLLMHFFLSTFSFGQIIQGKSEEIAFNMTAKPDIDQNIPVNNKQSRYKFALIIGNEDYASFQTGLQNEANVEFAENDARIFKEYAVKTLGVPADNAVLLINAKAIEMNREIEKLILLAKVSNGLAEIIIYYAGHGLSDINSVPYIIPVDVTGSDLKFAINLDSLYKKLAQYPTKRTSVFIDACFSGGGRNEGLVAARAVKIKPKESGCNQI